MSHEPDLRTEDEEEDLQDFIDLDDIFPPTFPEPVYEVSDPASWDKTLLPMYRQGKAATTVVELKNDDERPIIAEPEKLSLWFMPVYGLLMLLERMLKQKGSLLNGRKPQDYYELRDDSRRILARWRCVLSFNREMVSYYRNRERWRQLLLENPILIELD